LVLKLIIIGDIIVVEVFLFELGAIIILALVIGVVIRALRQPLILAYIIVGIIAGPLVLNIIQSQDEVLIFAKLGVAFLLFLVGLNLKPSVFKEVGKISVITGLGQVLFTSTIGYIIGISIGLSSIEALYVSIALTFSSTIIIVKLLSDKKDLDSLYGKISVGFLLVQDFIAIFILVILSGLSISTSFEFLIISNILKIALLFGITLLFAKYVIPMLINRISLSQEMILLSGISWMMGLCYISFYLGFSIEIGALLAGISMARLPFHYEIESNIRPLRDFFLILFFVMLGSQMIFTLPANIILLTFIFSIFVLVGNPIIVMILMGLFGYKRRTGFLAGLTVAQISEFSFILVALGFSLGHIGSSIVSLVTSVGIITITISTIMIIHSNKMFPKLSNVLGVFERTKLKETLSRTKSDHFDIVLIGYHRMGHSILKRLSNKKNICILDFNPNAVKIAEKIGLNCIYGDISDMETVERILHIKPKVIVSTIPNYEDNMALVERVKRRNKKIMMFLTTNNVNEALNLYKKGADYVILPYFLGGHKASSLLGEFLRKDFKDLKEQKRSHKTELNELMRLRGP
jgi:Kef-type K+ transport system membrane component KefB